MSIAGIAAELHAILTEEYLLSGELLAMIGREKQQLECGNPAALDTHMLDKHCLLDKLQAVTTRRIALLGSQGAELPGQWTASLAEFPALARQHMLLLDLVQKLQDENQALGDLVNRKARFVSLLLDQLQPAALPAATYHSNGSTHPQAASRRLITV
jgi:flagellar biosynthesis/type III secretory pathway chaperone